MTVRPKEPGAYVFSVLTENAKCVIGCFPRQKWEAQKRDDGNVRICRKNVIMYIPEEDYEKHWEEVGK